MEFKKTPWVFKDNSLDLLRLIAACQVMVLHSFEFTMKEVTGSPFFEVLRLFPGVPIFFFISGYLITRSYERSASIRHYWINRGLRIYPALAVCVFVNIFMVWSTGYFEEVDASLNDLYLLFLGKATVLQFYNPEFMRGFGDGVLNGSLWTICVELQFYFLVPFLYKVMKLRNREFNTVIIGLILLGMIANRLLYLWLDSYSEYVLWKLYRVSFLPWAYMFLFGMFVQRNFGLFAQYMRRVPLVPLVLGYVSFMLLVSDAGQHFGNSIPPYVFFILALVAFRFSYALTNFTKNTLKGQDLSYGIYIWHMPVINQVLYLNETITFWNIPQIIIGTLLAATISWFFVERFALSFKTSSMLGDLKKGVSR